MEMWRPGHPSPAMGKCREMASTSTTTSTNTTTTDTRMGGHCDLATNTLTAGVTSDQSLPLYAGGSTGGCDDLVPKIMIRLKMFIRIHFHLFCHDHQASAQTHSLLSYKLKGHAV